MKNIALILAPFLVLFLVSCEKDELPVPAHDPGDVKDQSIGIGSDYLNQIYFSLEGDEIPKSNAKTDWDLAFECGDDGYHIFLNTANGMALYKTSLSSLSETIDPATAEWTWDVTSGNTDSTAFGDWNQSSAIYLIDRGYDEQGDARGMTLVKPEEVTKDGYQFSFRHLDATEIHGLTVNKSVISSRVHASLSGMGGTMDLEPEVDSWELLFTQYTHLFDGPTPYLVTGVLINMNTTEVALDTTLKFEDISRENLDSYVFHGAQNRIGYDWKVYDYQGGVYHIRTDVSYLIRKENGIVWKLHFVDFYNESGERGYPRFEYQEL
ncbi:HmuY family protein [bacterium SCSIO 12741]|nr:HmuY family protein [bacterium SCSIO 12741]